MIWRDPSDKFGFGECVDDGGVFVFVGDSFLKII